MRINKAGVQRFFQECIFGQIGADDLENGVTAVLYFVCKRENASHLLFLPPINVIRSHMLIVWSLISRRGSDT